MKKKSITDNRDNDELKQKVNEKIFDDICNSGLTEREQDFVLYYLESHNATQSYLKAYGKDKKFAHVRGFELLHKQKIKTELNKLKKIMRIGYDIDPSQYLEFLLKSANADIGDYIKFSEEEVPLYDESGTQMVDADTGEPLTKKVNKMHLVNSDTVDTSVITEIKQGRDGISIKLVDKSRCWDKIKDYFEWKKNEEDLNTTDSNIIEAIQSRTDSTWNEDEDVNKDLSSTLKED